MMWLMTPALVLMLLLASHHEDRGSSDTRTVSHPLGWTIAIPVDREAVETETGFDIREPNADSLRSPATIVVRSVHPAQASDLEQARMVDGVDIRYSVEEHSGGSGGTEYSFRAERPLCDAVLSVHQVIQREFGGTPAFTEAWAVIASADC